ncbi:C6 finger domain-containing protein [Blastomyces dermatitidis ATCC 18188]|uniref:C6 finger domain-containing protein n=1 Tax=Ajellomyces dermatitidis (strain ATCC 18188 / CBS 674.68) TaxID=653446 RepID=F2T3K0_AJEDA|nr:C6 finger domain-containing protein [Blastomyces dermatitidis ATCC 18188]
MPYSNNDLAAALEFTRPKRPKLTPDGLPYHYLEDYIKYDLRYRDPLKCPSTWVDDDPSGDFELYDDSRSRKSRRPSKRKPSGPPTTSELPIKKVKTSNDITPNQPPAIEHPSIVNLKFKSQTSKCFLALLGKTEGNSVSSSANIDAGPSKQTAWKTPPKAGSMSPPAGRSSVDEDSSVTVASQGSQETLTEKELRSHEPLSSQDAYTSVKLQGQEAQYSQHKFVASFSKMVEDAILQSSIRTSIEPRPEQHDSREIHTPLLSLENSALSQKATPSIEEILLRELSKTSAETDLPVVLEEAASCMPKSPKKKTPARCTTTSTNLPSASPPQTSDYCSIIPNVLSVKRRKHRTAGPITKRIRTSFAHPIAFTHTPSPDDPRPCHWCQDFTYGMLGLGQLQVDVLDRRDGKGYAELSTGHASSGYEPSRMCSKCALYRVAILECNTTYPATHSVVPIPGMDESSFDDVTTAF